MKIMAIAFIILLVNISASIITNANIFEGGCYYESEVIQTYVRQNETLNYTSITDLTQQAIATMNIVSAIFSTLSFNWISNIGCILSPELKAGLNPFILGLNVIVTFLIFIAVIEIIFKRSEAME